LKTTVHGEHVVNVLLHRSLINTESIALNIAEIL